MYTLASKFTIQPKLTVGEPDDRYEQEADRVADQVMRIPQADVPIQRKCEDCEEEAFQMKPINQTATPQIQKQEEESTPGEPQQPTPVAPLCDRSLPPAEIAERNRILNDFIRGLDGINDSVRTVIVSSMCDFSLHQLTLMQQAGLRFWIDGSMPPPFTDVVIRDSRRGSASYARAIRTVFIGARVNPGYLTHEMAHAWDHIRILPRNSRVRLDDINATQRTRIMENPGPLLSETNRRQTIQSGDSRRQMTFSQMHAAYNSRVPLRELAFSRGARAGYSRSDPQEFYAEGYSVFHGTSILEQAKLYQYARELYVFLSNEALAEQMPIPDLQAVRTEAGHLPPPR